MTSAPGPEPDPVPAGREGTGPTSWAHYCGRCGKGTPFGFSTKRGMIWACTEHSAIAKAMLVMPHLTGVPDRS